MKPWLAATVLAILAAACQGTSPTPPAVTPTLAAIHAIDFTCGGGIKDNVPSGLSQWACEGTVQRQPTTILVDGNDEGVAGLTLNVHASMDPSIALAGFRQVAGTVPPLTTSPKLAHTLDGSAGDQVREVVGGVAVIAECDATQCIVMVVGATDRLGPLPLP